MKVISSFLAGLLLAVAASAQSQLPTEAGYIRFMTLVQEGEGNTFLRVNGKQVWEPGYTLGQLTGALVYPDGTHKFEVSREGCLPASKQIVVNKGEAQTLIAYDEEVFDDEGKSLGYQIKLADLKQHTPEDGIVVTLVSFCEEETLDLTIEEAMAQKRFKQAVPKRGSRRLQLSGGGEVRARVRIGKEVLGFINVSEAGNHIAVIYPGEDEKKTMKVFFDPAFQIAGKAE